MVVDLSAAYPNHGSTVSIDAEWPESGGLPAVCRVGFKSMEVPNLPDQLLIGDVMLLRTPGPVESRATLVVQRPTHALVWDKTPYATAFGGRFPLTIAHVPMRLASQPGERTDFTGIRDEAYSAVGLAACILDDRIAEKELFEDFLLIERGRAVNLADRTSPTPRATHSWPSFVRDRRGAGRFQARW